MNGDSNLNQPVRKTGGESADQGNDRLVLARKSWTAYGRPTGLWVIAVSLALWGLTLDSPILKFSSGGIGVLLTLVYLLHILYLRSVVLFQDLDGVWLQQGLFTWSRGVSGVKWRDVDEATFHPSFFSWLFRSYSIRVTNRFKPENEIAMDQMSRGSQAAAQINTTLQAMIREKKIST